MNNEANKIKIPDKKAPARNISRRSLIRGMAGGIGILGSASLVNVNQIFGSTGNTSLFNESLFTLPTATEEIKPFKVSVPQGALDDLKARLKMTRLPEPETVNDWSQGVPVEKLKPLLKYWRIKYDWRRFEQQINSFPQFRTEIDGLGIHFLHIRSKHKNALPLLLTHGWPGSVVEFFKTIHPLTDPTVYGGKAEDAFHLVIPSLPGFGFTDKPSSTGWNRHRVAKAWDTLMMRLGYQRYVAQGGDWGSIVTAAMGQQRPKGLAAIHLNMPAVIPRKIPDIMTTEEQTALNDVRKFFTHHAGYAQIQFTRPQTIGYSLADSPAGQAAWIYEKFAYWTDSNKSPETVLTMDEMLDGIMLYWLTNAGASSARMYYENQDSTFDAIDLDLPVGCSIFPGEIYRAPKSWAEKCFHNLIYWNEVEKGGHFAAFEQPEIFVRELRKCFGKVRDI